MRIVVRATGLLSILLGALSGNAYAQATTDWPIEPTTTEHPLGNTLGEAWLTSSGVPYQHSGIDVLATPLVDFVVATVEGTVKNCTLPLNDPGPKFVQIEDSAGNVYRYAHMQDYDGGFGSICAMHGHVTKNQRIATVAFRGTQYHHLHYDITSASGKFLNPLLAISPNPDPRAPEIGAHFAKRFTTTPWEEIERKTDRCTTVGNQVDVVVQANDQDNAGSTANGTSNVGLYNLRWRACPNSAPNCTAWNETHVFNEMPTAWNDPPGHLFPNSLFSVTSPFATTVDEMSNAGNVIYMVPSNLSPAGSWDTTTGYSDGSYTVRVEAYDLRNVTTQDFHVCIQNGPGCVNDLVVSDAQDDVGTVPYEGAVFFLSPDITANPGSGDEDHIKEGASNTVEVRVWNRGGCDLPLPAGTTYEVCLGWNPPSGSIPFPLAANQIVSCKRETIPAGEHWLPGTSRTSTFNWTPVSGSVPSGHACLVAWVSTSNDPTQFTSSVVLDNNRAQRNIVFVPLLQSGTTSAMFWMYPLGDVPERNVEINFTPSEAASREVYLAVPPSVHVTYMQNARVIASFRDTGAQFERCLAGSQRSCLQECPIDARGRPAECTLVLGGFGASNRVVLDGVTVDRPAPLQLAVNVRRGGQRGGPFAATVVERGGYAAQRLPAIGGVSLRFEDPNR